MLPFANGFWRVWIAAIPEVHNRIAATARTVFSVLEHVIKFGGHVAAPYSRCFREQSILVVNLELSARLGVPERQAQQRVRSISGPCGPKAGYHPPV
jgi:hypothetical protein